MKKIVKYDLFLKKGFGKHLIFNMINFFYKNNSILYEFHEKNFQLSSLIQSLNFYKKLGIFKNYSPVKPMMYGNR